MKLLPTLFRLLPVKIQSNIRWSIANSIEKKLSVSLPEKAVRLTSKHVQNCKLLPDRFELLKKLPANAVVAEIGVFKGDYAKEILNTCKPRILYLIDSWKDEFAPLKELTESMFKYEIERDQVVLLHNDSIATIESFPDKYFDWVYLDSDHSYEHTLKELNAASRKMKDEGIICGHDYTKGNWLAWIRFGVIEAVNEFCVDHDYEFVYFTIEPSMYFSYGIRKIK